MSTSSSIKTHKTFLCSTELALAVFFMLALHIYPLRLLPFRLFDRPFCILPLAMSFSLPLSSTPSRSSPSFHAETALLRFKMSFSILNEPTWARPFRAHRKLSFIHGIYRRKGTHQFRLSNRVRQRSVERRLRIVPRKFGVYQVGDGCGGRRKAAQFKGQS